MAVNRPTRPTPPAKPTTPAVPTRARIVKRYVATCLLEPCDFVWRAKPKLHGAPIAAVVESLRHLREAHLDNLFVAREVKRTVAVQRTIIGEELVD